MSTIRMAFEPMGTASKSVVAKMLELQETADAVVALIESLEGRFTGDTATAYTAQTRLWNTSATQVIEGGTGLGTFLISASDAVLNVDNAISEALGGAQDGSSIVCDAEAVQNLGQRLTDLSVALSDAYDIVNDDGRFESGKIDGALDDWRSDWSDKRHEMVKTLEALGGAATASGDNFALVDTDLAGALAGE